MHGPATPFVLESFPRKSRPHIIVIGHGVCGKLVVSKLLANDHAQRQEMQPVPEREGFRERTESKVRRLIKDALADKLSVTITVVESRDFYEADALGPMYLSKPYFRAYRSLRQAETRCRGVTYVQGTVDKLEHEGSTGFAVTIGSKVLHATAIVLCTGTSVPVMKPLVGQEEVSRLAELNEARMAIRSARRVLIAGGGAVGIESAGGVKELMRSDAKLTIVMSEALPLTAAQPIWLREALAQQLAADGVELIANAKVLGSLDYCAVPGRYELSSGHAIEADVFLPLFTTCPTAFLRHVEGATDSRGRLRIEPATLQSTALPGLFAVGCSDLTNQPGELLNVGRFGAQAQCAATNAVHHARGEELMRYQPAANGLYGVALAKCGFLTDGSEPWITCKCPSRQPNSQPSCCPAKRAMQHASLPAACLLPLSTLCLLCAVSLSVHRSPRQHQRLHAH